MGGAGPGWHEIDQRLECLESRSEQALDSVTLVAILKLEFTGSRVNQQSPPNYMLSSSSAIQATQMNTDVYKSVLAEQKSVVKQKVTVRSIALGNTISNMAKGDWAAIQVGNSEIISYFYQYAEITRSFPWEKKKKK